MKILKKLSTIILMAYCSQGLANTHPTIVLIHGALFTSRVWAPIQGMLQNSGYNVITLDTPGRLNDGVAPHEATLLAAVEKICYIINLQPEPVILVGHNQAGAMITQATQLCGEQIKALVYIAAVVPRPGEKPFDQLSDEDNQHFDLAAPLDNKTGLSIPDPHAPIKALLMADSSDADANQAINDMVPEPIALAYNALDYNLDELHKIPMYYVKTMNDVMISPASQNKFIERERMNNVITLASSHCPFISQPKILAEALVRVAKSLDN